MFELVLRAIDSQRYSFLTLLSVNPFDKDWSFPTCVPKLSLRLLISLRIHKGIAKTCFFSLKFSGYAGVCIRLAFRVSVRTLVESERERTSALLVQSLLILLDLLDKARFDLKFWSARIEKL